MRRIAGVKIIDKEGMEELREEVGVKEGFRRKLARSWLKWAGDIERIEGEWLMKRAVALRVEKRKTETEMGGLREERFSGSGRGVGGEGRMRVRDGGSGDGWWRR